MKRLPTQFDSGQFGETVATPTCSSCCCCCCCLATSITTSSLLAQRINKEAKRHNLVDRVPLTIAAALFIPISVLIGLGMYRLINAIFSTCRTITYPGSSRFNIPSYETCTNPAAGLALPIALLATFLVLWYLYVRIHIKRPGLRAILITIVFGIGFAIEFWAGMMAILFTAGVGGVIYLFMIPVISGFISAWYFKHLRAEEKDLSSDPKPPIAQSSYSSDPIMPSAGIVEESGAPHDSDDQTTPQPPSATPSS